MNDIRAALSFISADDRDTWVRCGMGVKSELGDEGFDIWNEWSATGNGYNERDARIAWKSFKAHGRVTIATVFALARRAGWTPEKPIERRPAPRQQPVDDEQRHAAARAKAESMIKLATMGEHPYLVKKGFPNERGLVHGDLLLIPMRDLRTYDVNSVQTITADGEKKFLAGGKAKGSVFAIGAGKETYLCEGYATGLSVRAALGASYRQGKVYVCFSAANLSFVAKAVRGLVIADNDRSGAGLAAAEKSGCSYWISDVVGEDFNDFHLRVGIRCAAEALNRARRRAA